MVDAKLRKISEIIEFGNEFLEPRKLALYNIVLLFYSPPTELSLRSQCLKWQMPVTGEP